MEKIYDPIEKNEDDLGNFEIHRHVQKIDTPLKPYNFRIKQFFIRTNNLKVILHVHHPLY